MWPKRRSQVVNTAESKKALAEATRSLKRVQARSPVVTELATSYRGMRERNGFADRLKTIMEGSPNDR